MGQLTGIWRSMRTMSVAAGNRACLSRRRCIRRIGEARLETLTVGTGYQCSCRLRAVGEKVAGVLCVCKRLAMASMALQGLSPVALHEQQEKQQRLHGRNEKTKRAPITGANVSIRSTVFPRQMGVACNLHCR